MDQTISIVDSIVDYKDLGLNGPLEMMNCLFSGKNSCKCFTCSFLGNQTAATENALWCFEEPIVFNETESLL